MFAFCFFFYDYVNGFIALILKANLNAPKKKTEICGQMSFQFFLKNNDVKNIFY